MNATTLADGLKTIAAKVLTKAVALPVLSCVRARPYPGGTEWTVTNMDTWSSIKIDGPEIGPILIPFNWLRAALIGEEVTITTKKDKVIVESGNLKATSLMLDAAEFPDTPSPNEVEHVISVDADRLRRLGPLLSKYEGRRQIEHFQCTDGDIWATNGRLACRLIGAAGKFYGVLPGVVPWGMSGVIELQIDKTFIVATSGNHTIVSRRVEFSPTDCSRVCGALFDTGTHWEEGIPRKEFIDAITPLIQMDGVTLDFAEGTAVGSKPDVGELETKIPVNSFAEARGNFQPSYLIDCFNAVGGETVQVHMDPKGALMAIRGDKSDALIMGRRAA